MAWYNEKTERGVFERYWSAEGRARYQTWPVTWQRYTGHWARLDTKKHIWEKWRFKHKPRTHIPLWHLVEEMISINTSYKVYWVDYKRAIYLIPCCGRSVALREEWTEILPWHKKPFSVKWESYKKTPKGVCRICYLEWKRQRNIDSKKEAQILDRKVRQYRKEREKRLQQEEE